MNFFQQNPAIVIDNGSGFTKIGFAGMGEPHDIFPTAIARSNQPSQQDQLGDLNFISPKNQDHLSEISSTTHKSFFPIKHGYIEDWDTMELIWQTCMYHKLRVNPEEHYVLWTEPPLNSPENREQVAEVMFETFGVPGLCISVQAILALAASWTNANVREKGCDLTGLVVDSGYGCTNIVPVVDGLVMSSCIEQLGIGGRDVTAYIQELMRERKEPVPHGMAVEVARIVKEQYCYTCPNIEKEFEKFDSNPEKYIKLYEGIHRNNGNKWSCNVSYERFLAPEVILNPEIYNPSIKSKLADIVDDAIQKCPIDTRRSLYDKIVLSGGSTVFKDFSRRLQRDVKRRVDMRLENTRIRYGVSDENMSNNNSQGVNSNSVQGINVNVIENNAAISSVWLGGSILASSDQFYSICPTKAQYEEEGSRIFRNSVAFKAQL